MRARAARTPADAALLVYVIDDDPLICDLLSIYLARYDVRVCRSARQALDQLHEMRPSLIILDIDMPDIDGLTALRSLRSRQPWHEHTPVMMLTSSRSSRAVMHSIVAGATDYMAKPFTQELFMRRVRRLLRPESAVLIADAIDDPSDDAGAIAPYAGPVREPLML